MNVYYSMTYLCIIQARLASRRFPNKVMHTVGGKTMVKRVWEAAMASKADKVVVLWPERNPDIPETDLFTPFSRLIKEFKPKYIIRLTADCPLLTSKDINEAIELFNYMGVEYYNNCRDGYDVQIFTPDFMRQHPHKEHVLAVKYNYNGFSVNTKSDLAMVRQIAR